MASNSLLLAASSRSRNEEAASSATTARLRQALDVRVVQLLRCQQVDLEALVVLHSAVPGSEHLQAMQLGDVEGRRAHHARLDELREQRIRDDATGILRVQAEEPLEEPPPARREVAGDDGV